MHEICYRSCLEKIKPYVPGKPAEEVRREMGIKSVIKLASNENPLGVPPLALEAMSKTLPEAHHYPDGNSFYLKQALSEKLGVDPDQILVSNGSDESLKLIAETYINPDDEGVMAAPTFSEYEFVLRVMGGVPRKVSMHPDFSHDLEAMLAAVNRHTRLIFLCSPNNPTGTVIRRTKLEEFLDRLPRNVLVVLDEAYVEYIGDPGYFDALDYVASDYPVIVLRTFSKIYGLAGLRIGYAVAAKDIIAGISRVREPFNVNIIAQAAALAALKDKEHFERSRTLVEEGKKQMEEGLFALGLSWVPTEANFLFIDLELDSRQVFQELLRRGVIIRTGDVFDYPNYIRVTIGTASQNERFLSELKEVMKFFKE